ncbi:hypothetical protein ACFLYD_07975, partial [Chloroflexota bacterium]
MQTSRRPWRIHVRILMAYVLLALLLTWPLAARFGSHVPGNGVDDPPLTWNLWWVQHALLELGANPFHSDHLFYPLGINLAFYTLTVLNGLLSIPLQAAFGLVPASNLLLLSSLVLSGYGTFLLASCLLNTGGKQGIEGREAGPAGKRPRVEGHLLAAFAAGLLYAFASSKLAYAALGQWNITSSQWIPFYVLYLFKMGDDPPRWRYGLMAALFLLLQAYAELTYASFLVLFTLLWAVWHLAVTLRSQGPARTWRLAANLGLTGLVFVVGLTPILAMMIPDMLVEGDILSEGGGFAGTFSADLLGYLVPTMYHPLFGSLVKRFRFDHTVGQQIFLGASVLATAAGGVVLWGRRRRPGAASGQPDRAVRLRVWFWVLSAFVFWLLTLGPTLRINGHSTGLPLPFQLVAALPFFKGNRYPSRYSVLLVLSLAILLAFGLAAIAGLIRKRRWQLAVGLLLCALI